MNLVPCMGGFCLSREHCQHYHATQSPLDIVERLCGPVEEPEIAGKTWIQARYVPLAQVADRRLAA